MQMKKLPLLFIFCVLTASLYGIGPQGPDTADSSILVGTIRLQAQNFVVFNAGSITVNGIHTSGIELIFSDLTTGEKTTIVSKRDDGLFFFFPIPGHNYALVKIHFIVQRGSSWADVWADKALSWIILENIHSGVNILGHLDWQANKMAATHHVVTIDPDDEGIRKAFHAAFPNSKWNLNDGTMVAIAPRKADNSSVQRPAPVASGQAPTASTTTMQPEGERVALVIGNGNYSGMPQLKNPVSDATDISDKLKGLGFEVTSIYDANRKQMDQAVTEFREMLSRDRQSEGFFYYAGHGIQSNGVNYLIPTGADISSDADLEDEAVSLQRVLDNIEEAGNRVNIVVLDACRNNPLPVKVRSAERGLAIVASAPPESIVLFSTAANQTALDGDGRNSPFAKALLDHMADPGDITNTIKLVTSEVKNLTAGKQAPFQYTSLDLDFSLAPR
jgi:hypothetical protein